MLESALCICCLKKQERFLKSKGKDIVCCSLKTLNELEEAEEKERQTETERAATVVTAKPSSAYVLALLVTETDPFTELKALSLSPKV
jgi:DNA modification methylase